MLLHLETAVKSEIGGFFKSPNDNHITRENNNKPTNERKLIIEIGERGELLHEAWATR